MLAQVTRKAVDAPAQRVEPQRDVAADIRAQRFWQLGDRGLDFRRRHRRLVAVLGHAERLMRRDYRVAVRSSRLLRIGQHAAIERFRKRVDLIEREPSACRRRAPPCARGT